MWKSDPSNPANNPTAAAANPAGATPAAVAQPTSQVSNVSNAANPVNTTSNAAVNTAPNTTPAVAATAAATGAKTSVGENLQNEKTKSDVDEFEIQEDEILQYKNAMETDQMKKDLEKKLEIANNKVNLFKSYKSFCCN